VSESRTRQRFPLRLPVQIEAGQSKLKATTHDLSAGGVFIEADPSLRMGARVGFRLVLPAQLLGTPRSVTVECQGRVVRVQKPGRKHADGKRQIGVACVIDSYKFVRKN
jgi:PilZ domain